MSQSPAQQTGLCGRQVVQVGGARGVVTTQSHPLTQFLPAQDRVKMIQEQRERQHELISPPLMLLRREAGRREGEERGRVVE